MQLSLALLYAPVLMLAVQASALPNNENVEKRGETRGESYSSVSKVVGYPHGSAFNELSFVDAKSGHKRIKSITLGPCVDGEHFTYVELEFADWYSGATSKTSHGWMPAGAKTAKLELKEYWQRITSVQLTTWQKKTRTGRHTRLGWMTVMSSAGVISCGAKSPDDEIQVLSAPKGSSLLHFSGTSGDAIDSLQAYFITDTQY